MIILNDRENGCGVVYFASLFLLFARSVFQKLLHKERKFYVQEGRMIYSFICSNAHIHTHAWLANFTHAISEKSRERKSQFHIQNANQNCIGSFHLITTTGNNFPIF